MTREVIYEEIGVDESIPGVKKAIGLAIRFADKDGKVEYMKLKQLIDGKLDKDKKVEFNLKEDEKKPEDEDKEKKIKKLKMAVKSFYKSKKIDSDKFFESFTVDGKTVDQEKMVKTLTKELKEVKEEDAKLLFKSMAFEESGRDDDIKKISKAKFIKEFQSKAMVNVTPIKFDGDFEQQVRSNE